MFLSGSILQGTAHATSDYDVYVVTEGEPALPALETPSEVQSVALEPPTLPILVRWLEPEQRRVDAEYWLERQVAQVLAKVEPDGRPFEDLLTTYLTDQDHELIHRLSIGRALGGEAWLAEAQRAIASSAFRTIVASRCLNSTDAIVDDALGQLESGDVHSAVLSARNAFGYAVDALLAAHGELSQSQKWRARKLRRVAPAALPFDEYWCFETMQGAAEDPAAWVRRVVRRCRALALEVDLR